MPAINEQHPPASPVKRRFDSERSYRIAGTSDRDEAETFLLANTSATDTNSNGGITFRDDWSIEPIADDQGAVSHGGLWECRVHYGPLERSEPPQTGDSVYGFEISTENAHVTQSKETVQAYAAAGFPVMDFQQAIGVTDQGAEGTDVPVPVFKFTVTQYFAHADLVALYGSVLAYAVVLNNLVARTNDSSFYGFAAGEVLFVGTSGGRRGSDSDWEITFHFAASPNLIDLEVGTITGIAKKGWEYLWVLYETVEDTDAFKLVTSAVNAFVERLFDEGDFGLIGIGT